MGNGGFCTDCGFRIESFEGLSACPSCGTTGMPSPDEWQVTVTINWHELRILAIWAENWQREHVSNAKVVYAITDRLQAQQPELPPLTLVGEIGEIAKAFKVEVSDQRLRQDIAEQTGQEVGLVENGEAK